MKTSDGICLMNNVWCCDFILALGDVAQIFLPSLSLDCDELKSFILLFLEIVTYIMDMRLLY